MPQDQGQKFIQRNRTPRVQIEYDLETYGTGRKIASPFIACVTADLAGKPEEPLPPVAERKFLEINVDNFNDRLKALHPRIAFTVPNALSREGNMSIDLTFESMGDFTPDIVARKVESLRKLLEARERLSLLLTYMDGKDSAEQLIGKLLHDKNLREALVSHGAKTHDTADRPLATGGPMSDRTTVEQVQPSSLETLPGDEFSQLLKGAFRPRDHEHEEQISRAVDILVEQALGNRKLISADAIIMIQAMIAAIDKKLTDQVNLILHHEDYQQLESAWRGLHHLVNNTEVDQTMKIRFMCISKRELGRTRDCPDIGEIMIRAIRRVEYVAGWGFADGMDAAIGWNGD